MSRTKDMKVVKGWWKKISQRIGPGMITGAAVQEMCARIGIVTRHGLAGTMRRDWGCFSLVDKSGLFP